MIWPVPNECKWGGGYLQLDSSITISGEKRFLNEAELVLAQLEECGTAAVTVESGGTIQLFEEPGSLGEEGYILDVCSSGITIRAGSGKGVFYGLQALVQLIENSKESRIPLVSITDAPFKPVRGMHMYIPPRDKITWFKRFVDFLAKYRYNTIFLEIGAAVRFDSHPEINGAWEGFSREMLAYPGGPDGFGMQMSVGNFKDSVHIENGGGSCLEKHELAELVEYIRLRHIDIIPEVQGLSHNYWMLMAHKECAERDDDPYPDTWCPSNPESYRIYFDCLQEIIDLVRPKVVHIGHDEYYTVAMCEKCRNKTGHDILAEDVLRIHDWLAERNIRTAIWGDKLFGYTYETENGAACGGYERLNFNRRTKRNELMKATFRAVDMLPSDMLVIDWYHTLEGRDTRSQDHFARRGYEEIFGNFDDIRSRPEGIPNLEERLRRPNVLGAECSLWQETSDRGLAMKDALVYLLDASNILWYEGYKLSRRYGWNPIIAQVYPRERDRMNGREPFAFEEATLEHIDLTGFYNAPPEIAGKYAFLMNTEPIPNTIPFKIDENALASGPSCILAGGGMPERVEGIKAGGCFKSIAFLHSYTENLGGTGLHACTYIGPEQDIVGWYAIKYADGSVASIPIEYSRNITYLKYEFGAYWADPVYQSADITETVEEGIVSRTAKIKADVKVVFGYEWRNPRPDEPVDSISIIHDAGKKGGIILLGATGLK